ncbi:Protein CBG14367 [Caenorhabditis briggsae]|uniref:Protein CBG14367 n=1 Tax=Caenorhabditis briggsae TaxID=6238 RepID=A8XJU8_CAEBR|nr:Protein CBG14367 [Caenorhabditis briggsae]CAP32924.2 Protein CBG14367 [Caenorhabditis briggsae]
MDLDRDMKDLGRFRVYDLSQFEGGIIIFERLCDKNLGEFDEGDYGRRVQMLLEFRTHLFGTILPEVSRSDPNIFLVVLSHESDKYHRFNTDDIYSLKAPNRRVEDHPPMTTIARILQELRQRDENGLSPDPEINENLPRELIFLEGPPGTRKTRCLAYLSVLEAKLWISNTLVLAPKKSSLDAIYEQYKSFRDGGKEWLQRGAIRNIGYVKPNCVCSEMDIFDQFHRVPEAKMLLKVIEMWEDMNYKEIISRDKLESLTRALMSNFVTDPLNKIYEVMEPLQTFFALSGSPFLPFFIRFFKPNLVIIDDALQVMTRQEVPEAIREARFVIASDPHLYPQTDPIERQHCDESIVNIVCWLEVKPNFSRFRLDTIYHRNRNIMGFAVNQLYPDDDINFSLCTKGELSCTPDVNNPARLQRNRATEQNIAAFDTSMEDGKGFEKCINGDYINNYEIDLCIGYYESLVHNGIDPAQIAILVTTDAQKAEIRKKLDLLPSYNLYWINSKRTIVGLPYDVQGKEFDVVLFSLVRNNPMRELGIMNDFRFIHAVMSRAKLHFCFFGSLWMLKPIQPTTETSLLPSLYEILSSERNRHNPSGVSHYFDDFHLLVTHNFGERCEQFLQRSNDGRMKRLTRENLELIPFARKYWRI